jgi:hypothetical protein
MKCAPPTLPSTRSMYVNSRRGDGGATDAVVPEPPTATPVWMSSKSGGRRAADRDMNGPVSRSPTQSLEELPSPISVTNAAVRRWCFVTTAYWSPLSAHCPGRCHGVVESMPL